MAVDPELLRQSVEYLDRLFGPGAGQAHARFLDRLGNPALCEQLHRAHVQQAQTEVLSVSEHYLLGLMVLCAQRQWAPAAMFTKTLRHLGVERAKVTEAVARLATFVGPVPASEAAGHVAKALDEYDREGLKSMKAWFPGLFE